MIVISICIAIALATNVSKFTSYRGTILLAITIPLLYLYIYYFEDHLYDQLLHDIDNETIVVSSLKPILVGCLIPVTIGGIFLINEL